MFYRECAMLSVMTRRRTLAISCLAMGLMMGGCVAPDLLPMAAFTFSPMSGESPLTVIFNASGSQSPDGVITEFSWDFGDGTTGQGKITAHSYLTDVERTFTVTLQITDHLGKQASVSAEVTVEAPSSETDDVSVEFVWPFHYDASGDDAANLNDEYFTLQNTSGETIDLSGWTVENERGVAFRIPNGVMLTPNAMITIHSGSGQNTGSVLYWNAFEPIWNNTTDLAILRNAEGAILDYYSYYSC